MLGGRPTKYEPIFCEMMLEYFSVEPWEEKKIEHFKNGEKSWTDVKRLPNKLPTMIGFWRHLKSKGYDVGMRTLYDWIDPEHSSYQEEFSHIFTYYAKEMQKDHLIQNGLQGGSNPVFAKFVAVNLTDMRDKVDNTHSGPDGGPIVSITTTIIDPKESKEETEE